MKKFVLIIFFYLFTSVSNSNSEDKINIGIFLGFSGLVETLTPSMADSIELPFKEIVSLENFFNNMNFKLSRVDSGCNDIEKTNNEIDGLSKKNLIAIIGGACPGISKLVLLKFNLPNKIIMISPADSSFDLNKLEDKKLFFRTVANDTRMSEILADITKDRGIKKVAITFSNTDYDKNMAFTYKNALENKKIQVTIFKEHKQKDDNYSKYVSSLAAAGGEALAIFNEYDTGGKEIVLTSLDSGMFEKFIFAENMISDDLINYFENNLKNSFGVLQGSTDKGFKLFEELAINNGIDPNSPFVGESYDAASLLILAIKSAGSLKSNLISENLIAVANKPGVKIYPGQIEKALKILEKGKPINYEGATKIEFSEDGDTKGSYLEIEFKGKKLKIKKER
tara:strand:- start:266 stop:1453 length:1188 start_codon:yes stop_codon:yes gene_type:complete